MLRKIFVSTGIVVSAILMTGCGSNGPTQPQYPHVAPVNPPSPINYEENTQGSLYNRSMLMDIYADGRAHRVGDILTIVLEESTQSSKSASTSVDKTSSMDIGTGATIFGAPLKALGKPLSASVTGDRVAGGNGSSDMSNSLSGNITVTVLESRPNGILVVAGEKWLTLNQGDEYIRISGIVRTKDVDLNNSVPSTKLADARITYSGKGAVQDANTIGWLSRFFISAIFPF